MTTKVFQNTYDDTFYWKRVNRNLGWLGDTDDEQRRRQEQMRDAVIGVAGAGGIGGAVVARLVRMGVRHIKVADPDEFEVTNIQRQMGADVDHLGRNKAEVVAEIAAGITDDVHIEAYPDGITPETAEEFVDGCDFVLDQMELYQVRNRYALHRAFRASDRVRCVLKVPVIGHTVIIYKYTHESATIEEIYDIPEDAEMDSATARKLIERAFAEIPSYPDRSVLERWLIHDRTVPIFAAAPPVAEGIITERLAMEIVDYPGATPLPVQPGYAIFDTRSWTARIESGAWWT